MYAYCLSNIAQVDVTLFETQIKINCCFCHLRLSPASITCACHLILSPVSVTWILHLLLSPASVTCVCQLILSPATVICNSASITCFYHLILSPALYPAYLTCHHPHFLRYDHLFTCNPPPSPASLWYVKPSFPHLLTFITFSILQAVMTAK